jgi:hypothetical protein
MSGVRRSIGRVRTASLSLVMLIIASAVAAEELIPSFDLHWFTIDHGGGASGGNGFDLHGTIGQMDAPESGELSGGSPGMIFTMSPGYWPGVEPQPVCLGDVAPFGGDGVVNIDDLLIIIGAWGTSNPQYDIAPPVPGGGNGIVNIDDLLLVINSWGMCPPPGAAGG